MVNYRNRVEDDPGGGCFRDVLTPGKYTSYTVDLHSTFGQLGSYPH